MAADSTNALDTYSEVLKSIPKLAGFLSSHKKKWTKEKREKINAHHANTFGQRSPPQWGGERERQNAR